MPSRSYGVRKPIYGARSCTDTGTCIPSFSPLEQLTEYVSVLETLEILFDRYFTPTGVVAPFMASFGAPAFVGPSVGVRVVWRYEHPGEVFDMKNPVHVLQIKVIYQMNRWNWRDDPLFKQVADPTPDDGCST